MLYNINMKPLIYHLPAVPKKMLIAFGKQLKTARKDRQWRQADLAERLGLTRQTIARMEKGDPGVSAGQYFSVAWLLGVTILDLDQSDQPISKNLKTRVSRKKDKPIDDNF